MLTPPSDLDVDAVVRALASWRLRTARFEYLPVGFGGHHWSADGLDGTRAFVTVDDLSAGFRRGADVDASFAALERAYRTAAALRDVGRPEFVVAPLESGDGVLLHRLDSRYAVSVAPFTDGTSSSFGPYESSDERRRMGELLGRLHAAGVSVPAGLPRHDDCMIPSRSVLSEALGALDRSWETGPFAEPTRALLAMHADELEARLRDCDDLAGRVLRRSASWVLTHGEPHRANVIVGPFGAPRLVDWDTTLIAPRERDLLMVLDDELTGWEEYTAVAGNVVLDRDALEFYRQWWYLADITVFVALFRRPHEEDDNTVATFRVLRRNLDA